MAENNSTYSIFLTNLVDKIKTIWNSVTTLNRNMETAQENITSLTNNKQDNIIISETTPLLSNDVEDNTIWVRTPGGISMSIRNTSTFIIIITITPNGSTDSISFSDVSQLYASPNSTITVTSTVNDVNIKVLKVSDSSEIPLDNNSFTLTDNVVIEVTSQ